MSFSFTHSKSVAVNLGGFREKVANPDFPNSDTKAFYYGSLQVATLALDHATSAYKIVLPAGVYVDSINVIPSTAFSAGATVEVGTTVGGTQVLGAEPLTAVGNTAFSPANPFPTAQDSKNLTLYVTIAGAPAAGAGHLVVKFSH